jgi:hypothetical protein
LANSDSPETRFSFFVATIGEREELQSWGRVVASPRMVQVN